MLYAVSNVLLGLPYVAGVIDTIWRTKSRLRSANRADMQIGESHCLPTVSMRERLLREKNMMLDAELCRAAELSREKSKTICGSLAEEVHAVQGAARQRQTGSTVDCKFCGKTHEKSKEKCPAYGKKCKKLWKREPFCREM